MLRSVFVTFCVMPILRDILVNTRSIGRSHQCNYEMYYSGGASMQGRFHEKMFPPYLMQSVTRQ